MGTTDALPPPGHDDEVVTTVADEEAARPVVEALLLAGLGPGLRIGAGGVEVTVVRGDGERARAALGLPADAAGPNAPGSAPAAPAAPGATAWPTDDMPVTPGAAAARAAAMGAAGATPVPDAAGAAAGESGGRPIRTRSDRRSTLVYLGVFLVALVVIPAVAFFLSFKAAGG